MNNSYCKWCNNNLEVFSITLPCGYMVCKSHLVGVGSRIDCMICLDHVININSCLKMKRNLEELERLENMNRMSKLEENLEQLERFLIDSDNRLKENYKDITAKICHRRDELKSKIIKEIDEYSENLIKQVRLKKEKNLKDLEGIKNQLNISDLIEKKEILINKMTTNKSKRLKLEDIEENSNEIERICEELEKICNPEFKNQFFYREASQIKIPNIFGTLKLEEKNLVPVSNNIKILINSLTMNQQVNFIKFFFKLI